MLISSSLFVDSYSCHYLCLDSLSLSNLHAKSSGDSVLCRNLISKKQLGWPGSPDLRSPFIYAWYEWRLSTKMFSHIASRCSRRQRKLGNHFSIVDELGGQYEDTFNDVKKVSEQLSAKFPLFFYIIVCLLHAGFSLIHNWTGLGLAPKTWLCMLLSSSCCWVCVRSCLYSSIPWKLDSSDRSLFGLFELSMFN